MCSIKRILNLHKRKLAVILFVEHKCVELYCWFDYKDYFCISLEGFYFKCKLFFKKKL